MNTFFYIIGLVFLIIEVIELLKTPTQKANMLKSLDSFAEKIKNKTEFTNKKITKEENKILFKFLITFLFLLWLFLGLLTEQWILFLIFLAYIFIIGVPLTKIFKNTFMRIPVSYLANFISVSMLIFMILNNFHLHIKFI